MSPGLPPLAWIGLIASLLMAGSASGHRLDEVLQAARVDVGVARLEVELDLTPGIETTSRVLRLIDLNGDGTLSATEWEAYADLVRSSLTLKVDGRTCPLAGESATYATMEQLTNGVGMIRLTFSAQFPPLRTGRHRVAFRNRHLPEASVYLANALRPSDPLVGVERQERDVLQRELTITVSIKAPAKVRRPPAAG
ncbi:MAG TPA: hypothetical protein DCM86_11920 [Verrucomicrobiales bacterium]|nr:hypothetical protein [Verrucomicrobiales bacterium]